MTRSADLLRCARCPWRQEWKRGVAVTHLQRPGQWNAGAGGVPFRRYSRGTPDASTEASSSIFTLNFEIAQAVQHSFAIFNIPDLKPRCQPIDLPVRI